MAEQKASRRRSSPGRKGTSRGGGAPSAGRSAAARRSKGSSRQRQWKPSRTLHSLEALCRTLPRELAPQGAAYGLATCLVVLEALGRSVDTGCSAVAHVADAARSSRTPHDETERAARTFASKANVQQLSRVLTAFASPHRLKILISLLSGPQTYRALVRATRLKAGPLYHHVNQLRLASFLGPKARDTYVLTRAGRNVLLVALSLGPLMRDRRTRPMPAPINSGG